ALFGTAFVRPGIRHPHARLPDAADPVTATALDLHRHADWPISGRDWHCMVPQAAVWPHFRFSANSRQPADSLPVALDRGNCRGVPLPGSRLENDGYWNRRLVRGVAGGHARSAKRRPDWLAARAGGSW